MPKSPNPVPALHRMQAVLRLLQGEALNALSQELKVQTCVLSIRRQCVPGAGEVALKANPGGDQDAQNLKALVEDLTLLLEVSWEVIKCLQEGRPLAAGRSSV